MSYTRKSLFYYLVSFNAIQRSSHKDVTETLDIAHTGSKQTFVSNIILQYCKLHLVCYKHYLLNEKRRVDIFYPLFIYLPSSPHFFPYLLPSPILSP